MPDLPCDGDGVCMVCRAAAPPEVDLLRCSTCATPWHSPCLSEVPALSDAATWSCPDCSGAAAAAPAAAPAAGGELVAAIRAIEADATLSDQEKARRRQELLAGSAAAKDEEDGDGKGDDVLDIVGRSLSCSFCMKLPDRPVTTPCGHNFCLKCFQKWIHSGKKTCGKCRAQIPSKMAEQPRINSALVEAIRMAKISKKASSDSSTVQYQYIRNDDRPDKAYRTERAKRAGKANASSGQIFVTIAPDHFGPILAENDPKRNIGVRVGETWADRLECRQWGAHFPHIAGIAGQSTHGAQSVALSGGYEDDEDHGEWFLYTGSGGRDLRGNKRTNKEQSFDQKFEKMNAALLISCMKGYPVWVVRSHKEKRSSYAPDSGVRYDGIYRIEKCWRKIGIQGKFKVCRYLFVRCENEPAPWTSDDHGDRPRPLPKIAELQDATDITERKGRPSWDYDEKEGWKWMVPPPMSRKPVLTGVSETDKQINREMMALIESLQQKAVEEGADDANECGGGDSEDNDGELAKEEEDISLNEDEQASAEENKMECQIGNSDVNADGSVKTVAEIKEGDQQPKEHKGDPEEGKDATMNRTSAAQVVDGFVEEDAVEEMMKSSKEVDNNESQQPQKRKGDDADIGADGTKRIKTSASMDETAVSGGTVQHIRKSGEE
ncbi:E3 ubiquitin-protein ligase ORTHRUS 2-like [Panicum miliaceum]|uniref:RING-type E3 ubiquitin transferase n=1 Tax=Panicum miliaceum TaxID=4540 RepID=A0A3L6REW9_PANMI|nr:E3 ubiquitin-protein ligase ORTHRUS 2-like [Panicum miliaceum]